MKLFLLPATQTKLIDAALKGMSTLTGSALLLSGRGTFGSQEAAKRDSVEVKATEKAMRLLAEQEEAARQTKLAAEAERSSDEEEDDATRSTHSCS